MTARLTKYVVVVKTKKGLVDLEIPTFQGPVAAGRRAVFALAAQQVYGDLDEIECLSITEGTFESTGEQGS
jgi:hypothetical protein